MRVLRNGGIGLAAVALIGLTAAAAMADGPTSRRYGMPSIWQGIYGGVHLGGLDAGSDDGMVGGVQLGYNWQTGAIVYGLEADMSLSGSDHVDWLASARGRLGYLIQPRLMVYGTAGLGMVKDHDTESGFAYGVGIEGKLTGTTSARLEYLQFDNDSHHGDGISVVRAGLNIKLW